jgi:YVTN family beta-propeller protein
MNMKEEELLKKTVLFVSACLWLLAGCSSSEQFPVIPPQEDYVITANIQDHSLSFINPASYETTTWTLPFAFERALLLEADRLLLYGKELDRAYVYELSTGRKIGEWKTGSGIGHMVLSTDGSLIYAADQVKNALRTFSLDGTQRHEVKLQSAPFTILESHDKLYVNSYEEERMNVIAKSSWRKIADFPTQSRTVGGWVDEEKEELWLGGHGSGEYIQDDIYVYSLTDGQLKEKIHTPVMPIDFIRSRDLMYVLSHGSNDLWKIDYETKQVQGKIETGSNPFSMKQLHRKLYIASYDSNKVQVIDLGSFETIQQIPVGTGPFQVLVREEDPA